MAKTLVNDSFEDGLKELEALIVQIEDGKEGLNSAVEKYANAQDLAAKLEKILKGVKKNVELEEKEDIEDPEEEE